MYRRKHPELSASERDKPVWAERQMSGVLYGVPQMPFRSERLDERRSVLRLWETNIITSTTLP